MHAKNVMLGPQGTLKETPWEGPHPTVSLLEDWLTDCNFSGVETLEYFNSKVT